MVKIRMARQGTKKKPFYRIVVADAESPRNGAFIEIVGTYDPRAKAQKFIIKADRVEHWTKCGAQLSESVKNLIKRNKAAA